MARGIILTDDTDLVDGGDSTLLRTHSRSVDQHLRHAVVYWDKVDIVRDPLVPSPPSPALAELAAAGILTEFRAPLPEGQVTMEGLRELAKKTLWGPFEHFKANNQREPGAWSFMPLGKLFLVPRNQAIANRKLEVVLYSKLPVPAHDTPVDKILKFKVKRSAELAAFRATMDDLYRTVVSSPESATALNSAVESLEKAVADAFRTMSEDFVTRALTRLRINFPIGAVLGTILGQAVGGPPGAVLGSLLSGSIGLEVKAGGVPKGSSPGAPFAYIHGVMEELM